MKKFLLFSALWSVALFYACQKDELTFTDAIESTTGVLDRDSSDGPGGGHGGGHHGGGHHGGGHPHDSTHVDSTGHGPHGPHDSIPHTPHDTINGHGHHHHHGGLGPGADSTGCHVPPVQITVTELPQAAQDWLAANASDTTVSGVRKITKKDCTVMYLVRLADGRRVRFDADGNKI